jgi:hypothetical protein
MATPKPIRLTDPFITLGEDNATAVPPTTAIQFVCFSNGIHLTGESDDDLATFCDPDGFAYTLSLDLKMSLGAGSLDEAFTKLGGPGTIVPFEFAYTTDPAAVDNPHWSGKVRIPAIPIVDAGINEPTSFTIDMEVIGEIERDDGTVVTVLGANPNHSHAPVTTVSTPEPETVAA